MKTTFLGEATWGFDTQAVRAGQHRGLEGEHAEALFLTSGYVFDNAEQAAVRFGEGGEGNVYSRFSNPTVRMFEQRLAALEGAEAALGFASGMGAITATLWALLRAGDHVVASQGLFGATVQLLNQQFSRFGISTSYVPAAADVSQWEQALQPNTRLLLVESPTNPLGEVVDIQALASLCRARAIVLVVDNCLATPALQQPLKLGADIVVHSATKFLDGQGRVLGGVVAASEVFIRQQLLPVLRTTGASLSAFNAWVLLKGMETLSLRMERHSSSALELAQRLAQHPSVARVFYAWLEGHPQRTLAQAQQSAGGGLLAFELKGGQSAAFSLINQLKLCSISANLGDAKTILTHPATTTHGRLDAATREAMGISSALIRMSVGLEQVEDLWRDVEAGL